MKVTSLAKVFLSDIQNGKRVVNKWTANENHYLLKRDNSAQPIQMLLSQKQRNISEFFFAFSKSILHFEHFPKKDDPYS